MRSTHGSVQSGGDFLSKNKLQNMEKEYQESRGAPSIFTASKVGSQVSKSDKSKIAPSIAPSKTATQVTRLSKISEE